MFRVFTCAIWTDIFAGIHREFRAGFVTAFGEQSLSAIHKPQIPGYLLQPLGGSPFYCNTGSIRDQGTDICANSTTVGHGCDEFEGRPTFIMSHDDIYNLAHHMNDVTMVRHRSCVSLFAYYAFLTHYLHSLSCAVL